MGFLRMIGLVTAEEHGKLDTKFKTAITDLEAATRKVADRDAIIKGHAEAIRQKGITPDERDELQALRAEVVTKGKTIVGLEAQLEAAEQVIAYLKPDAEAMRAKRKRDRDLKAEKAKAAAAPKAASKKAVRK